MFETDDLYVEVLLPLALPQNYTYFVPENLHQQIAVGKRVEIQFGKTRIYAGLIVKVEKDLQLKYVPKAVLSVLDDEPIATEIQLQFWKWIANYYMCTSGEVMQAALPAAFKLGSETKILLKPNIEVDASLLSDNEYLIYEALESRKELTVKEVLDILEIKSAHRLIKSLLTKQIIVLAEELKYQYKAKYVQYVKLNDAIGEDELDDVFEDLKRAKKQQALLVDFLRWRTDLSTNNIKKQFLLKQSESSSAVLNGLLEKGIFEIEKVQINRLDVDPKEKLIEHQLNEEQQIAYKSLTTQLQQKRVCLLHGITSSGKTQLYLKLMKSVIEAGGQVLYLLPEIALTAQIIRRLRAVLPCKTGVYHSKYNDNERIELWQQVKDGAIGVVVGARSSVFLPFKNLQLIIVDEAHDRSFKQIDPAPRYHARDCAIALAAWHKAKVVLGTATPSVENYFKATAPNNTFGLVEINKRFGNVEPPEIIIVDLKEAAKRRKMHSHFAASFLEAIKETLANNEQVILLQNRRGYAPAMLCGVCGYVPKCVQCDVSLTYHKFLNELICHQCNYKIRLLKQCPQCSSEDLKIRNFGTEKIEEDLQGLLPAVKVARMDLDTVKRKEGHSKLIAAFENKEIDVLVGTQMVAKGLDFDKVTMVGIINADQLLYFPDFRALENAYQLMVQASGRAGRRQKRGKVYIQTYQPENPVFEWIANDDYDAFYQHEIEERKSFEYPPFYRIVHLQLKHKDANLVNYASMEFSKQLRVYFGKRVMGPAIPGISYIRNYYLRDVLVKLIPNRKQLQIEKHFIKETIQKVKSVSSYRSVIFRLAVDV